MAIVPPLTEVGDVACIVPGVETLVLLRPLLGKGENAYCLGGRMLCSLYDERRDDERMTRDAVNGDVLIESRHVLSVSYTYNAT